MLFDAICRFGRSGTAPDLALVRPLYADAQRTTSIARRLRLLDAVADLVRDGTIGPVAYHSFMFHETQPRVIARAASLAVSAWLVPGDPLFGARELAGHARAQAREGAESRAVGLFAGIALLGAAHALECAGPCWRALTPNGRRRLARLLRPQAHAGIAEWLTEWSEECAGREFAEVVRTLAAIPRNSRVHPLVPEGAMPRSPAYDHRIVYQRFTATKESLDLERESPPTVAIAIAGEILLSQLNVVAMHLAASGGDVASMRLLLRHPWGLGYIMGVASEALDRCGVAQQSDEHAGATVELHRAVLGRIASLDLVHLSRQASRSPEFERGLAAGGADTITFWSDERPVTSLANWLVERSTASGRAV